MKDVLWTRFRVDSESAALGFAILAFSLFAAGDAGSKLVAVESNAVMALWGRSVAFALVMLPLVDPRRWRPTILQVPVALLLLRSVFPFIGGVCVIVSVQFIPLAQVTTVLFVAPLISIALACLLLGEKVNCWGWIAVALGFVGVVTITRPFQAGFSWVLLLPALGGVATAAGQIMTRMLAQRTSLRSVLVYMVFVALVLSSLPLPFFWRIPTTQHALLLALSGLCQAAGQACMIAAYARLGAGRIAPFSYAQLISATALGFAVFGEVPDLFTILGASLIVGGGLVSLTLARPRRRSGPEGLATSRTCPGGDKYAGPALRGVSGRETSTDTVG